MVIDVIAFYTGARKRGIVESNDLWHCVGSPQASTFVVGYIVVVGFLCMFANEVRLLRGRSIVPVADRKQANLFVQNWITYFSEKHSPIQGSPNFAQEDQRHLVKQWMNNYRSFKKKR